MQPLWCSALQYTYVFYGDRFQAESTEMITSLNDYTVPSDSIISFLVQRGADINAEDQYGSTALHFAAMRDNQAALCDLLSQRGCNIEVLSLNISIPLE